MPLAGVLLTLGIGILLKISHTFVCICCVRVEFEEEGLEGGVGALSPFQTALPRSYSFKDCIGSGSNV